MNSMELTKRLAWILCVSTILIGCSNDQSDEGAGVAAEQGAESSELKPPPGLNTRTVQPKPLTETEQLVQDLDENLAELKTREPQIRDLLKKYKVELARKLADLRAGLARNGLTLRQVREAETVSQAITALRRADRRCAVVRIYISRLDTRLGQVKSLVADHTDALTDLKGQIQIDAVTDPDLIHRGKELLANKNIPFNPDSILENPEDVVAMQEAQAATAQAIADTVLPDRPEKAIDDLPELPTLDFTTKGNAEEFLLADLKDALAGGKTVATAHLAQNRPEAAIESLNNSLNRVRELLAAFTKRQPVEWQAECLKKVDGAQQALSAQLAGPYLKAIDEAIPVARKSNDWSNVLDLLESLVRLAPSTKKLPEVLNELDTILEYRKNTGDFDAVVAWERLQEIRSLLTGAPVRRVSFSSFSAGSPAIKNDEDSGLLQQRQNAQNALATEVKRWLAIERELLQAQKARSGLLATKIPTSIDVKNKDREITQITTRMEQQQQAVSTAFTARDRLDASIWDQFETHIGSLKQEIARLTDPNGAGNRPDAPVVKNVEEQIAAVRKRQEAFGDAKNRVTGKSKDINIIDDVVRNPRNQAVFEFNSIGMAFVDIPAGEFWMGSPSTEDEREDDEYRHKVKITKPFQVGAFEVTVGEVLQWVSDSSVSFDDAWIDLSSSYCPIKKSGSQFVLSGNNFGRSTKQPMVEISYIGAIAFCEWLNRKEPGKRYRLPTEAEWEYMARAGSTTVFPGSNSLSSTEANFNGNHPYGGAAKGRFAGITVDVGSYAPNAWGVFDTVGNVWEWCADWYDTDYYKQSDAGVDPQGPSRGSYRVFRGGSWYNDARYARSANRNYFSSAIRLNYLGFRVARGTSSK